MKCSILVLVFSEIYCINHV